MFRATALFIFVLIAVPTWACDALLRAELPQITSTQVQYSSGGRRGLNRAQFSEAQFTSFIAANTVFAIPRSRGRFETVVFEPNPNHADRGYQVYGRVENGIYTIESVDRAQHFEETDYFKAVAGLTKLQAETVTLHRALRNCSSVMVRGWVQTKLWLKHRLPLADVVRLLDGTSPLVFDGRGRHLRYKLSGKSEDGRSLTAVIEEEGPCPNGLITAFEIGFH